MFDKCDYITVSLRLCFEGDFFVVWETDEEIIGE